MSWRGPETLFYTYLHKHTIRVCQIGGHGLSGRGRREGVYPLRRGTPKILAVFGLLRLKTLAVRGTPNETQNRSCCTGGAHRLTANRGGLAVACEEPSCTFLRLAHTAHSSPRHTYSIIPPSLYIME
jgi:hypothetical protein